MGMFQNKIAVVTGGAHGIGKAIAEEFRREGASVCVIDKADGEHFVGDVSDKETLERFAAQVIREHMQVDYLINNALPLMKGIDSCSYEQFQYALAVGVTAPFYLTKLFTPHFAAGAAIVNISEKAGFITGENICIDGGMTRQMIYHGDYGWRLTMDDL